MMFKHRPYKRRPPKRHTTTKNTSPVGMGAGRTRLQRGVTAAAIEARNRWHGGGSDD